MKLLLKFNLSFLLVFLLGLGGSTFIAQRLLQQVTETDVADRGRLLLAKAAVVRNYTATQIRPLLEKHGRGTFFPQSIPFYSVAQVLSGLENTYPDYSYKAAMYNPTNPHDRAEPWQETLIARFASSPELTEFSGPMMTPTGKALYVIAQPIRITAASAACLTCHSTPEAAPKGMIEQYGRTRGFGWKLDEVLGVQMVTVPMTVPLANADRYLAVVVGALSGVFALVGILLNFMLWKLVIQPVRKMATLADRVSQGDLEAPEFKRKTHDEIGVLADSFGRMRKSLVHAMRMLDA